MNPSHRPQFAKEKYTVSQTEEIVPNFPIHQVQAIDPDIGDPGVEQNITYYLDRKSQTAAHFKDNSKVEVAAVDCTIER